ncbi:TIM barrel protein [Cyclobacterium sp.]|uniref:sugar phosphate isomerase/epimerase family protein n=1 Tax=Cyclobacterium sp. TaxID=1966343 RepID=UPI0019A46F6E|nr:TIM barrel protein [Cyclobacterium sp.]MBD3627118.1 sugar phosphate isomerase/epimerase [Cyclobacterium sp.]
MNRRSSFKKILSVAAAGFVSPEILASNQFSLTNNKAATSGPLYLFTKVLQWLPLGEIPETVKSLGFDGIDLPVRKNGFFDKDEIKSKLPGIVSASENLKLSRPVLTTDMNVYQMNEMDEFLRMLAGEGIRDYRMGYLSFTSKDILEELKTLNVSMRKLADLHEKHGVNGHYQNHAGKRVGGSVWEIHHLLDGIQPEHIGIQFDLRHATVEGYQSHENAYRLIADKIRSFDLKDFVWGNPEGKGDKPVNVPMGEGHVNFNLLKDHPGFKGNLPKILHVEYDLGGAEHGNSKPTASKSTILSAIKKDVDVCLSLMS